MIVLALILVGAIGATASAWGLGRGGRAARAGALVGVISLIVVLVVALAMDAPRVGTETVPEGVAAFNGSLVPNDYLRLVIGLWGLDAVLLVAIAWLLGGLAGLRGLLPATLAAIVGGIVAFAATDLTLGAIAAGMAGLAALAVLLVAHDAVAPAARELRVAIAGTAVLVAVTAAAPVTASLVLGVQGPIPGAGTAPTGVVATGAPTEAAAVVGLLALAVALVVAVRLGVIPFHLRVPRLADVVSPISLPLLLAWIPVPLGVAAIAISDQLIAPLALPLDGERAIIVIVALVTLVAGALAAFVADDLRHAVGYLVIADAGLVLLGFAALDPAAWGPTRVWLVAMAASKTAVAAWSAVMEDRFSTRSVPDLRGWLRHSPIMGAALVVAAIATYGLPGWVAFEARGDLARLAAPDYAWLIVLAGLATMPTYLRLLLLGMGPATSRVRGAAPERFATRRRQETLPVSIEGPPAPAAGAVPGAAVDLTENVNVPQAASPRRSRRRGVPVAAGQTAGRGLGRIVRRDRTELIAAAVLALAILAGLTSWGALDLGSAASEAAPTVQGPSSD